MAQQCEMIVGFLVPHRCEHPALGHCYNCSRAYCEEHLSLSEKGMICTACSQGLEQPVALPITAQTYSAEDVLIFQQASAWDDEGDEMFSDLS